MDNPTFSQDKFAKELVAELGRLGCFATNQFRIPGTQTRLDIYIASPVRAFVEIKHLSSPSQSVVARLLQQAKHLRAQFGEEIVGILVAGGDGWSSSTTSTLRDAGFFVCSLSGRGLDAPSAAGCAKEIRNLLMHLPYQFFETRKRSVPPGYSKNDGSLAAALPFERIESPMAASWSSARLRVKKNELLNPQEAKSFHVDMSRLRAELEESTLPPDIFHDVLVSLNSLLSPEQFDVLEHELAAFSEEYRHEHYTACALRIGRTLEHVVYALAGAWGVSINRTTLQVLSDLNTTFDQLSRALIAYATTDDNQKTKRKKAVQDHVERVSGKLYKLVWEIDSDLHPSAVDVPVNVESILRDIKKQFIQRNKVRTSIDAMIDSDIFRKILNIRNDAAHASTSGARRELVKEEIDAAVEYLRTALFLFCNVAFAVAEKEG